MCLYMYYVCANIWFKAHILKKKNSKNQYAFCQQEYAFIEDSFYVFLLVWKYVVPMFNMREVCLMYF